jgi:hypothetical protein
MGKNRVFFPVAALDVWIGGGKVEISGDELTIRGAGRRYRILEAARVAAEVSGSPDANELVGKVKSKPFLDELGAELLETSMILGENAYDIVPGFLGAPVGTFEEHQAGISRPARRSIPPGLGASAPMSDEDLLGKFLLENR